MFLFQGNTLEPRTEAFSWKMCGSNTEALQIKTLSVAPDPIKVPGNVTMAFSASVKFPEPIVSPIEVSGQNCSSQIAIAVILAHSQIAHSQILLHSVKNRKLVTYLLKLNLRKYPAIITVYETAAFQTRKI